MSIFNIKQSFILYKHLAIFTRLCLFVNTRCVYSTQLRGSFFSRMLRQISHLFLDFRISTGIPKILIGNSYTGYKNLGLDSLRIDNPSYQLIFYLDKKDGIYHCSSKVHLKISKIAKFGCEML